MTNIDTEGFYKSEDFTKSKIVITEPVMNRVYWPEHGMIQVPDYGHSHIIYKGHDLGTFYELLEKHLKEEK